MYLVVPLYYGDNMEKQIKTDKFCLQEGPTNDVFDGIFLTCLIFWTPIDERLKPIFHKKTGWRRVKFASPNA